MGPSEDTTDILIIGGGGGGCAAAMAATTLGYRVILTLERGLQLRAVYEDETHLADSQSLLRGQGIELEWLGGF